MALSTRARRRHGQIDLITPPVPPRELHEHAPPARREILHFAKNGAPRKFRIPPEIETFAAAAGQLVVSSRKAACRTPRAGPHCCFLARIRKPSCFTSCRKPGPAEGLGRVGWQGWMKPIGGVRRKRFGGYVAAATATGVENACSLSFREAPRLGRRARGSALAQLSLRHDER